MRTPADRIAEATADGARKHSKTAALSARASNGGVGGPRSANPPPVCSLAAAQ